MSKKTPEEIAALKAKYGDKSAEKAAAKAAKQAKYAEANAEKNMPVCEIRIPWKWADEPLNKTIAGKEIDIDSESWQDYIERAIEQWKLELCYTKNGMDFSLKRTGPYKIRLIRT